MESRETENVNLIHSVCRQPGVQLSSMGRFVVLDERAMPRSVQVQISSLALRFLVWAMLRVKKKKKEKRIVSIHLFMIYYSKSDLSSWLPTNKRFLCNWTASVEEIWTDATWQNSVATVLLDSWHTKPTVCNQAAPCTWLTIRAFAVQTTLWEVFFFFHLFQWFFQIQTAESNMSAGAEHVCMLVVSWLLALTMRSCSTFNRRSEATKSLCLHQVFGVGLVCQGPTAAGGQNRSQRTVWVCIVECITLGPSVSVWAPTSPGLPFPISV